jgi:hypothetical protein
MRLVEFFFCFVFRLHKKQPVTFHKNDPKSAENFKIKINHSRLRSIIKASAVFAQRRALGMFMECFS